MRQYSAADPPRGCVAGRRRPGGSVGSSGYGKEGGERKRKEKLRSLIKGLSLFLSSGSGGRGALWGVGSCASSFSQRQFCAAVDRARGEGRVDGSRILCEISQLHLLRAAGSGGGRCTGTGWRPGEDRAGAGHGPAFVEKRRPRVGVSCVAKSAWVLAARGSRAHGAECDGGGRSLLVCLAD